MLSLRFPHSMLFQAKKVFNYVLDLNGSNEAAYVDDDPAFETTDFSIQAWV